MKKVIYSIIAIFTIFTMTSIENMVLASSERTIGQNDFALAQASEASNGVSYGETEVKTGWGTGTSQMNVYTLEGGYSYKLSSDINLSAPLVTKGTVSIDLNGHTISHTNPQETENDESSTIINNGNLTISNGSVTSRKKESSGMYPQPTDAILNGEGALTVTSGNYGLIEVRKGNVTINGGALSVDYEYPALTIMSGATATIAGSTTVTSTKGMAVGCYDGTLNVKGGTFSGTTGLMISGSSDNISLSGGTFKGTTGAIGLFSGCYKGTDASNFAGLLADGYAFSNKAFTAKVVAGESEGHDDLVIADKSISVVKKTTNNTIANNTIANNTIANNTVANNTVSNTTTNTTADTEVTEKTTEEAVKEQTDAMISQVVAGKEVNGISKELATKIKKAREDGKTIKVNVVMPEVKAEEVKEDAKKVSDFIAIDSKVAAFFDINLLVTIDGEPAGNVTELPKKVKFALTKPTNLPKVAEGYTRVWSIVKVHNGVTKEVEAKESGNKIVGESDEFSTYALVYTDVVDTSASTSTSEEAKSEETTAETKTSNPKTGDNIMLYVIGLAVSAIAVLGLVKKSKRI